MTAPQTSVKSVKVTIHLRDGSNKELSENAFNGNGDVADLKVLSQALLKMQERTNNELTRLVEMEKESKTTDNKQNSAKEADEADDDEEDEDDESDEEPPKKQQKR